MSLFRRSSKDELCETLLPCERGWDNTHDNEGYTMDKVAENHDDASSGYDSGSNADTESVCSSCSRTSSESHGHSESQGPEQEDPQPFMTLTFRTTQTLCQSLKLILAVPELCDVTFLVGPCQVPVHGIRAVMAARSRVLYDVIKNEQSRRDRKTKKSNKRDRAKRLTIPVQTYDPEVFQMLVEFIHCGTVEITQDTVAGLFCGACQFNLPDLKTACLEFVDRSVMAGCGKTLLAFTTVYRHHAASQQLFDKIYSTLDKRRAASTT